MLEEMLDFKDHESILPDVPMFQSWEDEFERLRVECDEMLAQGGRGKADPIFSDDPPT